MSITLDENEVISNLYINNFDRKSGTAFNFVVPTSTSFINFTRVKRIALSNIFMAFLPYNVYGGNNTFTVTDGVNSYTVTLPIGFYDFFLPVSSTSPRNIYLAIQTLLNANTFGWVFTFVRNEITSVVNMTCNVPVRISASTMQFNLGLRTTTSLSLTYTGNIIAGVDSNIFYICSRALTRHTIRDAHSNIRINNVVGVIAIGDSFLNQSVAHVERQNVTMKIFDFEPTEPIGSEIDIFFLDEAGREIVPLPEYESCGMTLEFRMVSVRNPNVVRTIRTTA